MSVISVSLSNKKVHFDLMLTTQACKDKWTSSNSNTKRLFVKHFTMIKQKRQASEKLSLQSQPVLGGVKEKREANCISEGLNYVT